MKTMNNKKKRINFVEKSIELIKSKGFTTTDNHVFVKASANNRFTLKVYQEDEHKLVYSIYGRYDKPVKISNPYSGKHNFHKTGDVDGILKDLDIWLNEAIKYLN